MCTRITPKIIEIGSQIQNKEVKPCDIISVLQILNFLGLQNKLQNKCYSITALHIFLQSWFPLLLLKKTGNYGH